MHLTPRKHTLAEDSGLPFYAGRKLGDVEQALVWRWLHDDPECPSRVLLDKGAETRTPLPVSVRQLNRLRVLWQLNRPKGRPRHAEGRPPVVSGAALVQVTPRLSCVGVHLFAHWLDQQETWRPVVARLTQAIAAHKRAYPHDDFALLHHREQTLCRRLQALFFAPVCGIDRLTAFETHEHPLETLLGRGYHRATRSQFLGQLERVGAAEALLPTLAPPSVGRLTSVAGHMIASWSRGAMHKGTITMLGRIMAGSQAVIAHNETGDAVFVAYHPPDIHMSRIIVAYCQQVMEATGSALFVIDRAVKAQAMASAFDAQGLGVLCMLDDHEHHGLESFDATLEGTLDDGSPV